MSEWECFYETVRQRRVDGSARPPLSVYAGRGGCPSPPQRLTPTLWCFARGTLARAVYARIPEAGRVLVLREIGALAAAGLVSGWRAWLLRLDPTVRGLLLEDWASNSGTMSNSPELGIPEDGAFFSEGPQDSRESQSSGPRASRRARPARPARHPIGGCNLWPRRRSCQPRLGLPCGRRSSLRVSSIAVVKALDSKIRLGQSDRALAVAGLEEGVASTGEGRCSRPQSEVHSATWVKGQGSQGL